MLLKSSETPEAYYERLHSWSISTNTSFWCELWDFNKVIGDRPSLPDESSNALFKREMLPGARLCLAENVLERADTGPVLEW